MATQTVPAANRTTAKDDNYRSYLRSAANLLRGDLAQHTKDRKETNEKRNKTLWQVLLNLLVYAQNVVYADGYTRKAAAGFIKELETESGLSNRAAQKYCEAVSTGLGVRGNRKGMRAIAGLSAACENTKTLEQFLNAKEISNFNQFRDAIRTAKSPIVVAAEYLAKLATAAQRDKARELADKMETDREASEDDDE